MLSDLRNDVFKALADPSRRRILDLLKRRPRSTGDLVKQFKDIGRCAVMKHLAVLNEAGLVLYRREGRFRLNYINPVPIRQIYERWMYPLVQSTTAQMISLKKHVESKPMKRNNR